MNRHLSRVIGFALAGLGVLDTAAVQAETKATDLDCASFLAMDSGQMNAIAAVVEAELVAPVPNPIAADVLVAAGIDPAAGVAAPPPMPGETMRVLQEACTAASGASLLDALNASQSITSVPVAPKG